MVRIHMNPTRSQPGVGRAFTESDLRRYPELIGQAIAYAINYTGTFEFMQQCQARALREGTLPLNICRAVLNCMRQDPDVVIDYDDDVGPLAPVTPLAAAPEPEPDPEPEPEPPLRTAPTDEDVKEVLNAMHPSWRWNIRGRNHDWEGEIRDDLDYSPDSLPEFRERIVSMEVPVKVKAPYGMSAFNGKVLHRVVPQSARASWRIDTWHGRGFREVPTDEHKRTFSLRVGWRCGTGLTVPVLYNERPEGVPYCKSGCFSVLCPSCQKITHLDPESGPEDKIPACRHCKQEFL